MKKETIFLDFCEISIYENYVVAIVNHGVNIALKHNKVLVEITENHFKNKPFVYITHRIHSYSVDPKIYFEISKIENLKGIAVVSKDYKAKVNAQIEKRFFSKPFEIFANLSDAFSWTDKIIKQ